MFSANSPLVAVKNHEEKLHSLTLRAKNAADRNLDRSVRAASELVSRAEALSPLSVLSRGFSYVTKDGENIRSVSAVSSGDLIRVRLSDGDFSAEVR